MKHFSKSFQDLIIILVILVICFLLASEIDLFEKIYEYSRDHEEYELDEILNVFFILPFLVIWYSLRRLQELKEAKNELKRLNENLEETIQQQLTKIREQDVMIIQQSKDSAISSLLRNISHQWRQPLNYISLTLSSIEDANEFNEPIDKKIIKKSQDELQDLSQTIDNFINYFSHNGDKESVEINSLFQETLSLFKEDFKSLNIKVEYLLQDKITIVTHQEYLKQIFLTLLTNSRDAIEKQKNSQGEITFTSKEENKEIFITLKDNGGGVTEENLTKIFEPYFSTKFSAKGIGLSLYAIKMHIENSMNGSIKATNIENGLQIEITLPKG